MFQIRSDAFLDNVKTFPNIGETCLVEVFADPANTSTKHVSPILGKVLTKEKSEADLM